MDSTEKKPRIEQPGLTEGEKEVTRRNEIFHNFLENKKETESLQSILVQSVREAYQ